MTYDVTASYTKEAAKLEGAYPVDMFVVNASLSGWEPLYYANLNQDIVGYSLNASGDLTYNATIYTGLPISRGEISTNTAGEIGEVSITVPNTDRIMESIIQSRKYLRGRDIHIISGFARHLPAAYIIDDETGASWGPTVHGLSLADGQAFLSVSGVDLAPYTNKNYKITLTDSVGKRAIGYVGAADAGETLGDEKVVNGDFASDINGWTNSGGSFETFAWDAGGKIHLVQSAAVAGAYSTFFTATVGKLYKLTYTITKSSGTYPFVSIADSDLALSLCSGVKHTASADGTYSIYVVPTYTTTEANVWISYLAGSSGDILIDSISVKEVTHTATTGVHIVSAPGGSTRNWTNIESGFNYNDSSYIFDVTYNIGYDTQDKYIGIESDKNAFLKEKLYIDSVNSNEKAVVFNCRSKFNIKNVVLPRRSFFKDCTWAIIGRYAASECSPQSTVNTASYPTCDGTLDNCRERHNSARFGGFPSIPSRGIYIV